VPSTVIGQISGGIVGHTHKLVVDVCGLGQGRAGALGDRDLKQIAPGIDAGNKRAAAQVAVPVPGLN
jgi:hypothetical protein